jgi:hypothetical protein
MNTFPKLIVCGVLITGLVVLLAQSFTAHSPHVAAVITDSPYGGTAVYNDDELAALERFHTGPNPKTEVHTGTHVEITGRPYSMQLDYGAGALLSTVFTEVKVLDGPSAGTRGWINQVRLHDLPPNT